MAKKKSPDMILFNTALRISKTHKKLLDTEAKETGNCISTIIRIAISEHFKNKGII
jgi:hypothetical protein